MDGLEFEEEEVSDCRISLMPVPEGQKKNAYPGGKSGLMLMMNPIKVDRSTL